MKSQKYHGTVRYENTSAFLTSGYHFITNGYESCISLNWQIEKGATNKSARTILKPTYEWILVYGWSR